MSRKLVIRVLREARETGRSRGAAHVLSRAFHPSAGLGTGRASWQPTPASRPDKTCRQGGRGDAEPSLGTARAAGSCDVAGGQPETAGLSQGKAFMGMLPAGWMLHHW